MRVLTRSVAGCPVLEVQGEVDIDTAPALDDWLTAALDGGATAIVVDLRRVGFLDSTGLTVLVRAHKRLAATSGALDVVVSDEAILRVLSITGLDTVLRVHRSLTEALRT